MAREDKVFYLDSKYPLGYLLAVGLLDHNREAEERGALERLLVLKSYIVEIDETKEIKVK